MSNGHPVITSLLNEKPRPRPQRCPGCPYKSRTCGPKGPIDSPFVIVGESPGRQEIINGLPFVGPSGKVLAEALKDGIEPYVTNSVCCMPIAKDRDNIARAVQSCHSRLVTEISRYPRKVILALGNAAVWSLTGDYSTKISATRGHIFQSNLAEHGIVACLHPAALMRGFGSSRLFKRDIHLACDLAHTGKSPYKWIEAETILMETESDVRDLIDQAAQQEYIAADLETTGFSPRLDYILSQGFCWDPKTSYIVPPHLAHLIGDIYNPSIVPAKFIWHNGKYDTGMLWGAFKKEHSNWRLPHLRPYIRHSVATIGNRWGYQFAHCDEDTMLLSYCIDETQGIHGLEVASNDWLGAPNWKAETQEWIPKKGASYANIPPITLYLYQGKDLSNTLQLWHALRPIVASDPKLEKLYTQHLIPASYELTHLEQNGFDMDDKVIRANKFLFGWEAMCSYIEWDRLSRQVLKRPTNPNSWQQVQKLLYRGGLDIADGKILKTDKDTLRAFPNAPGVKELQAIRRRRKIISVYINGMADAKEPNGRVYSTYKLHGSVTGRLASSDPVNLQNIVRDNRIKNQFTCGPNEWLLSIDLSQAELRVLATLSKDQNLIDIFKSGTSIHKVVAKRFYGDHYDKNQYQLAKAVTFGIVYGRDAFSIAEEYQISVKAAQEYIDNWFGQFPRARQFILRCRRAPIDGVTMSTPWGRKRRFGIVGPERYHAAGNEAANFPEQSMASDITLETLYTVGPTLRSWGVQTCNIVHDDIINRLKRDKKLVKDVIELITTTMIEVPKKRGLTLVPFEADWSLGTHWGHLHHCTFGTRAAA